MRIPRIYQAVELLEDQCLQLEKDAANHLIRVLRLPIGAKIKVFNGEGIEYSAVITAIEKTNVQINTTILISNHLESPLKLHLGQAISRGEKMDYTIQKAVELGVQEITPLITERCGVKLSSERWEKRLLHWKNIAIAACEQSGRNRLPLIHPPALLTQWLGRVMAPCKLLLHPHAQQKLADILVVSQIALLIGSEGGFTETEINLAEQHDFANLRLGPRVLRTETAAVAAIAILQSHFGDMN